MGDTYGGEVVGKVLKEEGVEYYFGVQGGHLWPLLVGITDQDIKMIHMRHEQAGAYAADAYSRAGQRPGVCFGTAGVGQENMAAGIAQAYYTQSPVLALFAQHAIFEDGLKGLQVGYGADLHRGHIKWGLRVIDGDRVAFWVRKALRDIMVYPQGPVVLDLPPLAITPKFNEATQRYNGWHGPVGIPPVGPGDEKLVEKAVKMVLDAKKPLIFAGDGLYWSKAYAELQEFAELLQIPVALRRTARGAVPEDHPLSVGGYRGRLINNADLILIIGHRIGYLEGYAAPPPFGPWNMQSKCIQITETPSETCLMVPTDLEIIGNPGTVVRQMIDVAKKKLAKKTPEREEWLKFLAESRSEVAKKTAKEVKENWKNVPLHPTVVGQEVANFIDESARDATVIFDSFTGTSFFTDKLKARFAGQVLDCAEQGGVGHGIGMGIGAQLARPGKPVFVYMGDLGMGVGGMDIETAIRYKLPVVYFVNCNGIAMAGTQKVWFEKTKLYTTGTFFHFSPNIRYDKMFELLGCHAEQVVKASEIRPALERAFNSGKTAVVNAFTDDVTPHAITVGPISAIMTSFLPKEMLPEWGKQLHAKFGM